MKEKTSIIIVSCNRKKLLKQTIDALYERLINVDLIHLIVIDNASFDGSVDLLKNYREKEKVHKLILLDKDHIITVPEAYNIGMKYVVDDNDFFICIADDIVIPKLEPDVVEQLVSLMKKYPDYGGISCRIQHIPNMHWLENEDITPARKGLPPYFRIQKKSDMLKVDGGFGKRSWDDFAFVQQVREKLGKRVGWATNLWANHTGYMIENRGYPKEYIRSWGWDKNRKLDYKHKPYPKIDYWTNKPLPGEKIYK